MAIMNSKWAIIEIIMAIMKTIGAVMNSLFRDHGSVRLLCIANM